MRRIVFFALGCALLAALGWFAGAKAVGDALAALGLSGLVLAGILHLPTVLMMAVAIWYCSGRSVALKPYVVSRLVRDGAADILPFSQLGGVAAALRVLKLYGASLPQSALAVFNDLLMEFAAKFPHMATGVILLLVLVPGTAYGPALLTVLVLLAAAGLAAALFRRPLGNIIAAKAASLSVRWTGAAANPKDFAASFEPGRLVPAFLLHLAAWFYGSLETYVVFALLGTPVGFAEAVVIDSLANTLKTFAFLVPAAAGVQEGAYVLVCAALGIAPAPALAFSLARRAREILLGLPALAVWNLIEARPAHRAP